MPTTGPNFGSTATGTTNTVGLGTAGSWNTPTNANAADGTFTTAGTNTGNFTTKDLNIQGFGFAITGTDTINGITVEINFKTATGADSDDFIVKLLKAGTAVGSNLGTATIIPTTATTRTYGGAANLWGTTWTPSDINNTGFGVVFCSSGDGSLDTVSVDFIRVTITSTAASGTSTKSQMLKLFNFR